MGRSYGSSQPAQVVNSGPGVLHLPPGPLFTTWAGWLLPYDRPIYLLGGHESEVAASARDLALIGIDDVRGWVTTSTVLNRWLDRHGEPEVMVRVSLDDALERAQRGDAVLLDVRARGECAAGHAPCAVHIPL